MWPSNWLTTSVTYSCHDRRNWLFLCDSHGVNGNGTYYLGERGDRYVERAMHAVIDMGASISAAHGMAKVNAIAGREEKPVAVIGDSTFLHAGLPGILSAVYNQVPTTMILLDNGTTGMTGHQEHPGTGHTVEGDSAPITPTPITTSVRICKTFRKPDLYSEIRDCRP